MGTASTLWVDATRWGNRKLRDARWVRRAGIAAYRNVMSLNRVLPPPRMLLNGHSKSGTHLLSDCVALMPRTMFSGRHFTLSEFLSSGPPWQDAFSYGPPAPVDHAKLRRFLRACPPGMFATSHVRYRPDVEALLHELGFRHVLLVRDPRDVVVSHVKFVLRQRNHFHHHYYANVLSNDQDRLMAAICGFTPDAGDGWPSPSIGESYDGYLAWRGRPTTLVTRFEDLVGSRGGGDPQRQFDEIRRIGSFLGRSLAPDTATHVADKMYSSKSFTYRRGGTGDWHSHFTAAHRAAFKAVAADLLIRLGYETDANW